MGGGTWQDIVDGGVKTQDFGCTDYSREWIAHWCPYGYFHAGIDIGCAFRAPVRITRSGTVVAIGIAYLGDQAVGVRTDKGIYIELGHCDQALVNVGDRVIAGQVVALADSRGASSGNHVHLEVRTDGAVQAVDPYHSDPRILDPWNYLKVVEDDMLTQSEKRGWVRVSFLSGLGREPESLEVMDLWANQLADDGSNVQELVASIADSDEGLKWRAAVKAAADNPGGGGLPDHKHVAGGVA